MYHGVINVYKEPGFTSHDVVAKLRGILRQKKIGHTGTLDPAAEGVLPVCLGQGTRLADMLTDKTKTYEAILLLGRETDTQDTTGQVLREYPVKVTEEEVRRVAASFVGEYHQIPPMYSALKVDGKKLYELARAGREVERQARRVQILSLSVDWVDLPRAGLTVTCSKGTYIRTLCHDLGRLLGCGGCMEHLKRTRVERFSWEDGHTLSQIEALRDAGGLEENLMPVEEMFDGPKVMASPEGDKLVMNGNPVKAELFREFSWEMAEGGEPFAGNQESGGEPFAGTQEEAGQPRMQAAARTVRVYSSDKDFLGIYEYDQGKRWWKPKKMFLGER